MTHRLCIRDVCFFIQSMQTHSTAVERGDEASMLFENKHYNIMVFMLFASSFRDPDAVGYSLRGS